jgi:tight adherence protein B
MSGGTVLFFALLGGAVFLLSQVLIVPAFGSDARTRKLLRQKLSSIDSVDADRAAASLLRQKYLRELSPLARRLEDSPHMEALGRVIEQAGLTILAHRLVALAALLSLGAASLAMMLTGNVAVAVLALAAGAAAPFIHLFRKRRARLEKFEEQLPDAVDVMKRALRAGHPFSTCIKLVSEDMDEPIAREFELTFADINYGNDARRALLGMLERVPSSNLMAVVTAVLIQKETGGNLAEIFERISQVIRSRFRFGRRVRTLSAEGRLSAWILTLVPIVLFGVIWITTPSYLPPMLDSPMGQKLLVFAVFMMVVAVFWMRKVIRIDL